MAAGNHIAVTPGSGDFIATGATYTEASTVVKDQKTIRGEPYLPTYSANAAIVSAATSVSHLMQLMAGASLNVRVRRVEVLQDGLAGTSNFTRVGIERLTSAGSGGTAITPSPFILSDPASGATAMTLPSAQGTVTASVVRGGIGLTQTQPISNVNRWVWQWAEGEEAILIPAGTANGIVLRCITGVASATVSINIEFTETPF